MRRAFTLVEILIVLVIVAIVAALALPTATSVIKHRQVSEAARTLQGELVGARDQAIKNNTPAGLRLIPDPSIPLVRLANGQLDPRAPLAYNRMVAIAPAPDYSNGKLSLWGGQLPVAIRTLPYPGPGTPANPNPIYGDTTALMVFESGGEWIRPAGSKNYVFQPNEPTSWFWNIRLGDRIQINKTSKWYTVIGPMVIGPAGGNTELFVNAGPQGRPSPWITGIASPDGLQQVDAYTEFLLLVNGLDDNGNGWIDEGWDGVDNDGVNGIDDIGEWLEQESG